MSQIHTTYMEKNFATTPTVGEEVKGKDNIVYMLN
jgi:hypothetical protein